MAMQLQLRELRSEELPPVPTPLARTLERQGRRASWVARQLNVHRNTISRWVNGREEISPARVSQLATVLGVEECEIAPHTERTRQHLQEAAA